MDQILEDKQPPILKRSDYSLDSSTTIAASPESPVHHRPGYIRISSFNDVDTSYTGVEVDRSEKDSRLESSSSFGKGVGNSSQAHGLGIGNVDTQRPSSVSRVAMGGLNSLTPSPSADPLLSPPLNQGGRISRGIQMQFEDDERDHTEHERNGSNPADYEPYTTGSDRERLHRMTPSTTEIPIRSPSGEDPNFENRNKRRPNRGRADWLLILVLALAIYSTVGSGIWLVVAMIRPRWGRHVTTTGKITPATASLLCTALAKSIELSFVTVFVTFLGQVLSRKAFAHNPKGITIAEMSMRAWVMQPGTIITQWYTIRYAAFSFLGVFSLLAALMAMLYTTASDALVAPKLKFGEMESRQLYGKVATTYANPSYIEDQCKTPVPITDPENDKNTCISIEHAGQAYHNYEQYLIQWTDNIDSGNGSASLMDRPRPFALLYDNTTVQGSWIHPSNETELSEKFNGRTINNVSMAMPHSGVFSAARDPLNNIIQPRDLNGIGEYEIRASVPSPAVNVLCANVGYAELDGLVKTKWPFNNTLNATLWPEDHGLPDPKTWQDQNKTALDEVFEWGGKYGRQRPIFAKYPIAYNSVLNTSKTYSDSMYLLATSPTGNYTVCSIRGSLTPDCSTEYKASMSGGSLTTNCDPNDDLSYHRSYPNATNGILDKDWINVAIPWANSISLNDGISDGQSANVRLLTQLILNDPALNPSLPSLAEALAVLSACTLLQSSLDSTFLHFWNYSSTVPILKNPQYQSFKATLRSQDYSSGGTQPWQNGFYIVLFVVFVTNVVCLAYLCLCGGLVTDFIEPHNLFLLSLNSPPSKSLDKSCGDFLEKELFETNWKIKQMEQDQCYIQEGETQPVRRKTKKIPLDYEMQSPMGKMYSRLASTRTNVF